MCRGQSSPVQPEEHLTRSGPGPVGGGAGWEWSRRLAGAEPLCRTTPALSRSSSRAGARLPRPPRRAPPLPARLVCVCGCAARAAVRPGPRTEPETARDHLKQRTYYTTGNTISTGRIYGCTRTQNNRWWQAEGGDGHGQTVAPTSGCANRATSPRAPVTDTRGRQPQAERAQLIGRVPNIPGWVRPRV